MIPLWWLVWFYSLFMPAPVYQPTPLYYYQPSFGQFVPAPLYGPGNIQPAPAPITNPCGWQLINGGWIPSGRCGDVIYFPPCQPTVCA